MKNKRFIPAALSLAALLLFSGCPDMFLHEQDYSSVSGGGQGTLMVSFSGTGMEGARTILPQAPEFTRYELVFLDTSGSPVAPSSASYRAPVMLYSGVAQLHLEAGPYVIFARGYKGDVIAARSDPVRVTVASGGQVSAQFVLKPYMGAENGALSYTLVWDGPKTPVKAELSIKTYPAESPIPAEWIPPELSIGSVPGTILLMDKSKALNMTAGSLSLPAGEYLLTMTVFLDSVTQVSRMDIAQVYSGLTSSGSFYYGGGDVIVSSVGVGTGSNFITAFSFAEYPNATSIIGSAPGLDGARLILVMLPNDISAHPLNALTPIVETAPGASITSPTPPPQALPVSGIEAIPETGGSRYTYVTGNIDFSGAPTSWTAVDRYGATQPYTVMVNRGSSTSMDCQIVDFFFKEFPNEAVAIDETAGTIEAWVPYGADLTSLAPVISIRGKEVVQIPALSAAPAAETSFTPGSQLDFSPVESDQYFRVKAEDGSTSKDYTVTVRMRANTDARITSFMLEGFPEVIPSITTNAIGTTSTIQALLALPYGTDLTNLKPVIRYIGKTLSPVSGIARNFSSINVPYTVTAEDGVTKRTYNVTITAKPGNTDTGIFDFIVTNVPNNKVVIGQYPRPSDGKIPIVIQVPYGTDENNMIPKITLRSSYSKIKMMTNTSGPVWGSDFDAAGNPDPLLTAINFLGIQEATFRVTAQDTSTQDYVVIVSAEGQYYYVDPVNGRDDWPDVYNGQSASHPFKTIAKAVYEASQSATINKIFVSGTITAASEGGVWYEDTGTPAFHLNSSGAPPALKLSDSVVNITGTNGKQITIVGVDGAGISGTTGKRAVSVTGGAKIVFENMTISGGRSAGNGGGVYIGGNSLVKFSGGMITGNQAVSGGGVYVGGDSNDDSEFDLAGGSVSGNTATGSSTAMSTLAGGGGVYVNGKSVFWLTNGTVANNTAGGGSGGGVLVNGWIDTTDPTNNRGFLMSGGSIANNKSLGSASPHGGGGVYVAAGEFDMLNGDISNNTSTRQGGGVFVHRNSIFSASGSSSILGNNGVGSSKALCSRGITELSGNARLDKVYVWNADPDPDPDPSNPPGFPGNSFSFTISGGARADGIVLAGYTKDVPDYNYITIGSLTGSDPVCTVDLESHLEDGKLVGSTNTAISNDWNGRTILRAGSMNAAVVSRFPLGSFTGSSTINLAPYWRIDSGTGKLVH